MKSSKKEVFQKIAFDRYFETHYRHRNSLNTNSDLVTRRQVYAPYQIYFPTNQEAQILDAGCGTGDLLLYLQDGGYHNLMGVDVSTQQIDVCYQRGLKQVYSIDILTFLGQQEPSSFDLIIAFDLIEHLEKQDVIQFLQLAHSSLHKGGYLLLRTPNLSNPFNLRSRYVDITHEIGLTIESLEQILRMVDFEPVVIRGDYRKNSSWYSRLLFDRILLGGFSLFYRRAMHLTAPVMPGKNLIALAQR